MERLVVLPPDEGRALYATLSLDEQAAMDARGLKRMWRSIRAREAHARRRQQAIAEFEAAVARGEPVRARPSKAFERALDKARERSREGRCVMAATNKPRKIRIVKAPAEQVAARKIRVVRHEPDEGGQ
jgi:hypothetical protein